jgi:hypothetical protein
MRSVKNGWKDSEKGLKKRRRETPVPVPNTAKKPFGPDDTWEIFRIIGCGYSTCLQRYTYSISTFHAFSSTPVKNR